MQAQPTTALTRLLANSQNTADAPHADSAAVFPATEKTVTASQDADPSSQAIRTITTEEFTINTMTLEVVATRHTKSFIANIEWSSDVFDMAMRVNLLANQYELDTFYQFIPNKSAPGGYLDVMNLSESISLAESTVFPAWSAEGSKKEGYTKGQLLDARLSRLRKLRASLDSEKGRLRMMQSAVSAPHADGGGEFTIGSNREIEKTKAAIESLNQDAIKLFHTVEQAVAHLNKAACVPVASRWLVVLPSPLGELTVLNPTSIEYETARTAALQARMKAAGYGLEDTGEDEEGEEE